MKQKQKYIFLFFLGTLLILLLIFLFYEWSKVFRIISYIFYGIMIAYILTPLCQWLERFIPRSIAAIAIFLLLIGFLTMFFVLLIPVILNEFSSLQEHAPHFADSLNKIVIETENWLDKVGIPDGLRDKMDRYVEEFQGKLFHLLESVIAGIWSGVLHMAEFFIIPVLGYYFLKDRDYFKRLLIDCIPIGWRKKLFQTAREIHIILSHFIRGELLVASIVGGLATIGFSLIKLPYSVILGMACGIFEFIPFFGPWLGAIPAVLVAFINAPAKILLTIIVVILIQQLEGSIITPRIMGSQVELHPVFIIVSLWIGGSFFGIWGMFLAIPFFLIFRVIIKNIYLNIVSLR